MEDTASGRDEEINISDSIVVFGSVGNLSVIQNQPKKQPEIDAVRKKYIDLCKLHEIQYVDNDVIKTRKFPINQFAVKLKMVSHRLVDQSFRGEMERYLMDLNRATTYDINIDKLVDESTRVTFLRGIAGIGKSVLAKQIVFCWAEKTMFETFDVCLFFECRELNNFKKGKYSEPEEVVHQFVKKKLRGLNVEDREESMLIVIDGVDELFDIKDEDSLIFEFLDLNKSFGNAKIIMTGRPHLEGVLDQHLINIGMYKVVEIMGLGDKEIEEYIAKFTTCIGERRSREYRDSITVTINASVNIRPLLCIPQCLNAICCVSVLTGGREIGNETELYSWTLYLLFKQHVFEREKTKHKSLSCNVFTSYHQLILVLGEISFMLYSENQIIFRQNDFKPLFDKIYSDKSILMIAKGFFDGLFVDKSDNFKAKLQFVHLSVMEYLSTIHVCSLKDSLENIKQLLENESFEIVRYACGLYGGLFQDGIVKELYTCVIEMGKDKGEAANHEYERKDEAMSFLRKILEFLHNSEFHDGLKFSKAVEFIVQFLCPGFDRIDFVTSVLSQLSSIGNKLFYNPDVTEQRVFFRFCNTIKAIGIDENAIKAALRNTGVGLRGIYDIKWLALVKYFGAGNDIDVEEMSVDKQGMKIIVDNLIYCQLLRFRDCVFENQFVETKHSGYDSKLDLLVLTRCKLAHKSFRTFSQWAVLSKKVGLNGDMGITHEFWETFGKEIDEAQHTGLKLEELDIADVTFDESSWVFAVKVFVKLKEVTIKNTDICEEWWKKLVDEVNERKHEGALNLTELSLRKPSNMNDDIQRSIQQCGVKVSFEEPKVPPRPSASKSGPSVTEITDNEPEGHSDDLTSSSWLIVSKNTYHPDAEDVPVKTLISDLISEYNDDELEEILCDFSVVVKDSHGCVPPTSIQEKIIFEAIINFVSQKYVSEDSKKYEVFDNLVRHIRYTALMKFERDSLAETVNKLEDRALAVKCINLLKRMEDCNTAASQAQGSSSRSIIAPIPFNSKKIARGFTANVLRKFDDQPSHNDLYIKGMTIWMRRWGRIPVYGGMEVLYSDGRKVFHGDRFDHEVYEFVLAPGEYIVKVIAFSGYMIDSLEFITNTGKSYGPYGGGGGNQCVICHPRGSGYLSHISGSEASSLGSLGIVSLSFHFVLRPEPGSKDDGIRSYGDVIPSKSSA